MLIEHPQRRGADLLVPAAAGRGTLSRKRLLTAAYCLAAIAIGYVDYFLGRGVSLAILYLLPVIGAAYYLGKAESIVVAGVAGAASLVADMLIGSSAVLLAWNTVSRTTIFVMQGWLVATLQREWRREADLARRDPVTGLVNSRTFHEVLSSAVPSPPASLAFIDLDNFKGINDRYGHSVGDDVLVRVAGALGQIIREGDIAARMGGDEFAVLLRSADRQAAEAFAIRLQELVRGIGSSYPGSGFGASAGIVIWGTGTWAGDELIRAADEAMYDVKATGKARWVVRELDAPSREVPEWTERRTRFRAG